MQKSDSFRIPHFKRMYNSTVIVVLMVIIAPARRYGAGFG